MSIGVRRLTLIGEFKPFGLIAEALDSKSAETVTENYEYFLFDPEIARDQDDKDHCDEVASALNNRGDHELFIRGKRIIWSIDARVFKRFTMESSIVKVCWCHLGHTAEALLCILQIDRLTIYSTSGEVVSVQLPRTITSIWPLPFGLLLQQEVEASTSSRLSFSSTSPLLSARDVLLSASNHIQKRDGSLVSSHLILMDPLDEQQPTFIEERRKLNVMKEYDEKTIWTSAQVSLMASYNKGKMQHSLWVAEIINSNFDEAASGLFNVDPMCLLPKHLSFRRIWQGKGAQTAACKVFMATGDDAVPVVCFFHQEQRKLLSVSLQTVEINNEIVYDVKPDMSWIIAAVAASPVMVTRPRVKIGVLPYADIMVLTPENALLLYSGKQCLCRYVLPSCLNKDKILHDLELPETSSLFRSPSVILTTPLVASFRFLLQTTQPSIQTTSFLHSFYKNSLCFHQFRNTQPFNNNNNQQQHPSNLPRQFLFATPDTTVPNTSSCYARQQYIRFQLWQVSVTSQHHFMIVVL